MIRIELICQIVKNWVLFIKGSLVSNERYKIHIKKDVIIKRNATVNGGISCGECGKQAL